MENSFETQLQSFKAVTMDKTVVFVVIYPLHQHTIDVAYATKMSHI
jgi:hypothetical protein